MQFWPWAVVTAVCATTSTMLALYLHRDDACTTMPPLLVPVPTPPVVRDVPVPAPARPPVVERVRELPFDAKAYPQIEVAGTLVRGVRWHDANGDNVVVFSDLTPRSSFETSLLHAS